MKNVMLLMLALFMQKIHGLAGGVSFVLQDRPSYSHSNVSYAPIASPSTTSLHESARQGSRLGVYCRLRLCGGGRESINEVDGYGETPLMAAAKHGHLKTAKLLIRYGAIVNKAHGNRSPLWHALQRSHLNIAAILILGYGARIPFDCIHQSNIRAIRDLCNMRNEEIKSIVSSLLPKDCATLIVDFLEMESLLEDRNDNELLVALQEEAQKRQQLPLDDFEKSYL